MLTVDLQLFRNGSMNADQVALLREAWRGLKTTDDHAPSSARTERRTGARGSGMVLEGSIFNEPHLPDALRTARAAAGGSDGEGFVVSLPQLFHARVSADFDNEIWNNCPPPYPPLHPLCSVDPESH